MSDLLTIFNRTDGQCHLCGKELTYRNYGKPGTRRCWEIEHSKPRALGGTDHGNNRKPACIGCNRKKGVLDARSIRRANGLKRSPISRNRREQISRKRRWIGTVSGALMGARLLGPPGFVAGAFIGLVAGNEFKP